MVAIARVRARDRLVADSSTNTAPAMPNALPPDSSKACSRTSWATGGIETASANRSVVD
jgi:hypothetical protein